MVLEDLRPCNLPQKAFGVLFVWAIGGSRASGSPGAAYARSKASNNLL
jgi:hypothetical protein